jgi:magnesium transporter
MSATPSAASIDQALRERNFARVRKTFADLYPADVAELIEELEEEQRAVLFRILPRDQAAETFEYLEPEAQEGLIKALAHEQVAAILNDMSPDDRTALLEELPASVTVQLLSLLTPDERAVARQLLGYPEDSIGRLMTPDFIALRSGWTVQQSLDHVRKHGEDSETLNVIYVVDDRGHLIDDLRMRQLLLADPEASSIAQIMDGNFVALKATDDQETAVRIFTEYDRVAFPVTDSSGILLGIVTVDDVLDVVQEEATEDIQKIGGMEALEQPYMQTGYLEMLRKRAGWLVLLFLGQLLTINALHVFTGQLQRVIALTLFVPLIISSGGNSGSQAATLVVRAMALEELSLRDWWSVMRREIVFGLTVGLTLAALGLARVFAGRSLGERILGESWAQISIAVGVSLVIVVLWGVTIGSMLPFVLRKLGADPATSSTPFVATIVDITGLIIYFTAATLILS